MVPAAERFAGETLEPGRDRLRELGVAVAGGDCVDGLVPEAGEALRTRGCSPRAVRRAKSLHPCLRERGLKGLGVA